MRIVEDKYSISDFSKHLFWDVDNNKLNIINDYKFIIKKVLIYGLLSDFRLINKIYGIEKIGIVAINIRELDKKTLSFVSLLTNTKVEKFICYNTEQSIHKHWNF